MKRIMEYEPLYKKYNCPFDRKGVMKQIASLEGKLLHNPKNYNKMPIDQLRAVRNRMLSEFDRGIKPRKELSEIKEDPQ